MKPFKGLSGCVRDFDWPDLPSTSVLNCEGQCREGAAGRGPTQPAWISQYCQISGNFYNGTNFENREFSLCRHHIMKDSNGVKVEGRDGKWSSFEVTEDVFEAEWAEYTKSLAQTLPFYRQSELVTPDINNLPSDQIKMATINGKRTKVTDHSRWTRPFPSELFSPILGPTNFRDINTMLKFPNRVPAPMKPTSKDFHGPGQPACGVMGNRAFVGSGKLARLMSLDFKAPEGATWKLEEGSEFPYPYKKSNGEECLLLNTDKTRDKFPNYRQNFGTVVTNQGLWIIGGLIAPSADLEGRALNVKYNIEGCTKNAHLRDVWVYNPRGWTFSDVMSGDQSLINKYKNLLPENILPKSIGYPEGKDQISRVSTELGQSFGDFRLSDTPGGDFGLTIDKAIEEGWDCTGVQG